MTRKGYGETLVEFICQELEVRANDPWPDEDWPAANRVLNVIIRELREDSKSIQAEAWREFNRAKHSE